MSGTGVETIPNLTEVSGTGVETIPNLTEDVGRVFTEKIPPVYFRTFPTEHNLVSIQKLSIRQFAL